MNSTRQSPICPHCYTPLNAGACPACGYRTRIVSRTKRVLLTCAGLLCALVLFGALAWNRYAPEIRTAISLTRGAGNPYADFEASVAPPEKKLRQGVNPAMSIEQMIFLRHAFEAEDFTVLTQSLESLQNAFEQDHLTERLVVDAFGLFDIPREDYRPLLDAWVAAYPDHYAPYLARGGYLLNMGWYSRGDRFIKDTPKDRLKTMREYFQEAYVDLEKSLALNPNLLPAYRAMISISNALGKDGEENKVFERARRLFPDSYLLYSKMMWAKLPRWGGSYAEMDRLATEAQQHVGQNRELIFLPGLIYVDQGWHARSNKDYEKSLAYYDKAMAYGDNASYYYDRSWVFRARKEYARELDDLNKCISLQPTNMSAYKKRAEVWNYLNDREKALQDIDVAWSLSPDDPELREYHTWATTIRNDLQQQEKLQQELAQNKVERKATTASFSLKPESAIHVEEAFLAPPGTQPKGLAWKAGKLYLSSYLNKPGLYEIDPADGKVLRSVSPRLLSGNRYGGLATDGRDLFHLAALGGGKAARFHGEDLSVAGQYLLRCAEKTLTDLTIHDQAIYVIGTNELYVPEAYSLMKFSLDGTLLESFEYHQEDPRRCVYNLGMTSDGRWLWVAAADKLLRIDPVSGNILHAYPLNKPKVEALTWDGRHIWAASFNGMVYKITITDAE